jgi:hypothetical protein
VGCFDQGDGHASRRGCVGAGRPLPSRRLGAPIFCCDVAFSRLPSAPSRPAPGTRVLPCRCLVHLTTARLVICSRSRARRSCLARKRDVRRCRRFQRREAGFCGLASLGVGTSSWAGNCALERRVLQGILTVFWPAVTAAGWISPRSTAAGWSARGGELAWCRLRAPDARCSAGPPDQRPGALPGKSRPTQEAGWWAGTQPPGAVRVRVKGSAPHRAGVSPATSNRWGASACSGTSPPDQFADRPGLSCRLCRSRLQRQRGCEHAAWWGATMQIFPALLCSWVSQTPCLR